MLKILEVKTKKDLDNFINFDREVYKNDKNFCQKLKTDSKNMFDKEKNPFWLHAKNQLFLLYDDEKLVGKIAGIIDDNYIKFQGEKVGFFGFFEVFDNINYSKILFSAVEKYLKNNEMNFMYGPINPSTNDEMGLFFEGEEGVPTIMMPYNPKYYLEHLEFLGFKKIKDLYAYLLDYKNVEIDKLNRLQGKLSKKFLEKKAVIRTINLHKLDDEINFALDVYNNAWEKNWGFVPWTKEEFFSIAKNIKKLADPRLVLFLEIDKKPAGMMIVIPDYNQVLNKLNGKLNIFKFLWYKRKINKARLMILGVKKEFRKQGFETLLYLQGVLNAKKTNIKFFEFSWILEDNILTQRAAEMMGGKLYRKYRVYGKDLC